MKKEYSRFDELRRREGELHDEQLSKLKSRHEDEMRRLTSELDQMKIHSKTSHDQKILQLKREQEGMRKLWEEE